MEQIKIGQFLKAIRKEKKLTQRQIAESLGISEKTVSKWETGSGLPEVSLMLPLCNLLGISVNELLSGERLDETRYYQKVEQNILAIGAKNKGAEDLLISEYMEKCVLRNFIANSEDIGLLQKFYCPNMPIKAIEKMIGDWNSLDYQGKYFEMFAIVQAEKVVGTLSLYEHSKSVVSIGIELFLGYCRKGYGTIAMNKALDICKEKGYKLVYQQVRADNIASIKLHHKVGFETDNYIYKNQKGHDVILFFKTLK